ncbi:MAG TPA: hypothetical protein PLK99_04600 [Burkholderiales bacterium]|nr:hypothetical protein [Burkholderiales bacterium]
MQIMLKWFGSGSGHPFANLKKARDRLADLPSDNPLKALEELSEWIESLQDVGLAARSEICMLFDEHSLTFRRKLGKSYFDTDVGAQRKRISFAFHRLASVLGKAYVSCVRDYRSGEKGADEIKKILPLLTCRSLNAVRSQYKWDHLHSGLTDQSIWKNLFWLFAYAEKIGIANIGMALYPAYEYKTSISQEFLKALMIAGSSPDALSAWEFEIANHIVSISSRHFVLGREASGVTHYVDLSSNKPPARLTTPPPEGPSLRFFGPGKAYAFTEKLLEGPLPKEVTRDGAYSEEDTHKVLRHLLMHWSSRPISRKSERLRVSLTLTIAHRLDFAETESWVSENISDGGFDAIIDDGHLEWEKIGMIFFGKQGDSWDLCIIRRLNRDDRKRWHAGAQILSRNIFPTEIRAGDTTLRAAIVHVDEESMEARILAEDRNFSPSSRYEFELEGRQLLLVPLELLEKGFDFRLWRCRLSDG